METLEYKVRIMRLMSKNGLKINVMKIYVDNVESI